VPCGQTTREVIVVRPFLGEEVKVERDCADYQDERRGALEETDNYRVCLILKDRPNLRAFYRGAQSVP
jgi:hypothetical protein